MEMNFASRGVANAGLTTGIIGTALGAMNNGLLGNIFGGGASVCSDNVAVNRYELGLQKDLTNKDMEIAYLKGRDAAKTDSLELYKYVDGRFRIVEAQIAQQAVVNAQVTANLSCLQNSVAALSGLTKTVIPISNVCPEPMAKYNSWTAPTTTDTTGG
jgi:hypothetical protein